MNIESNRGKSIERLKMYLQFTAYGGLGPGTPERAEMVIGPFHSQKEYDEYILKFKEKLAKYPRSAEATFRLYPGEPRPGSFGSPEEELAFLSREQEGEL